jgi:hypothetical protein
MINKKTKFALMLVAVFIIPFVLSACGKTAEEQSKSNLNTDSEIQSETMINDGAIIEDEIIVNDRIEFSDPGSDEVGKEIQEMDDLLNQTNPSEYNEENLSDSAVEDEVELR